MGKQIEDKGLHLPAPPRGIGSSEEPQHSNYLQMLLVTNIMSVHLTVHCVSMGRLQ